MRSIIIILVAFICNTITQENNVCKSIKDYKHMTDNCWYDFTVDSSVPEIIMKSGYPFMEYKVRTSDGYIITVFRIPNVANVNKRRYPVYLQHGLITTSANWVSLGNDSLAFQLYNQGYDVWMGNYRGNEYSEEHINLTVNDEEYWDYSVDDVALKDIPAVLHLIAEETGAKRNIIYIGHSLGCTFSLMYGSEYPEEASSMIKMMILTAPAYTLSNMITPIRYGIPFSEIILQSVKSLGLTKFVSHERTTKGLFKLVCLDSANMLQMCFNGLLLVYGPKTSIQPERYPHYFYQHPGGTAIKLIKHVSDFARNFFRKFDYGIHNLNIYGSTIPPTYDISKIKIPTYVIYAKNDWLTAKNDALNLYRKLPKNYKFGLHEVQEDNFNHIDFMFGARSKVVYVDYVVNMLEKYLNG